MEHLFKEDASQISTDILISLIQLLCNTCYVLAFSALRPQTDATASELIINYTHSYTNIV
jgi:hypothetical protein